MNSWTYRPPLLLNPAAIVRTPVTGSSCMVRRCGRGLPFLSVTRGRRIRNLAWNEIGKSTCRENRKHRDAGHDEEANLQCTQARIRVDAHRFRHLSRAKPWCLAITLCNRSLLMKLMLSRSTCAWISGGSFGFSAMRRAEWPHSAGRQGALPRQRFRRRRPDCWWCRAASRRRRQALSARR